MTKKIKFTKAEEIEILGYRINQKKDSIKYQIERIKKVKEDKILDNKGFKHFEEVIELKIKEYNLILISLQQRLDTLNGKQNNNSYFRISINTKNGEEHFNFNNNSTIYFPDYPEATLYEIKVVEND